MLAVSVDPKGDTPASVHRFVRAHRLRPGFRYLTGTRAQLQPIWNAYHLAVVPGKTVAHSSFEVLVDRTGTSGCSTTPRSRARTSSTIYDARRRRNGQGIESRSASATGAAAGRGEGRRAPADARNVALIAHRRARARGRHRRRGAAGHTLGVLHARAAKLTGRGQERAASLVKAADEVGFKPTTEPGIGEVENKPASAATQPQIASRCSRSARRRHRSR